MEIPISLFVCLGISAALAVGLPIVLAIYGKVRWRAAFPLRAAALGALSFVIAVLVLESLLHSVVFSAFPTLSMRPIPYTLYGCLAAGLFEETARYLCLRLLCRRQGGSAALGLAYGVGHGGIESLLLAGAPLVSSLATLAAVNGKTDAQLAALLGGQDMVDTLRSQVEALSTAPAWQNLLGGYERAVALALHLALSVLVWMAASGRLPRWFVFVAMGLHALANVPAALVQCGVLRNPLLAEGLITLASGLAVWYVSALYAKCRTLPAAGGAAGGGQAP